VIVLCVDSVERFDFFCRVYKALHTSYKIRILTTEPLVWLKAKCRGLNISLITLNAVQLKDQEKYVESSIEVLNGQYEKAQAEKYFSSIVNAMMKEEAKAKFVIWNGQHVFGRALQYCSEIRGYDVRYLEISNLPNLLFSDPLGVNANSSVAKSPALLDLYPDVDDEYHQQWIAEYLREKEKPLPQAQLSLSKKFQSLLNVIAKLAYQAVNVNNIATLYGKSKTRQSVIVNNDVGCYRSHYIFLPFQVSTDTQIKLHSKIDNVGALDAACQLARDMDLDLVCKIHPAETNTEEVKILIDKLDTNGFFVSTENTAKLIEGASLVVTINSTVGLEAMIVGKDVRVLGNALYKDFDNERLKKYIHRYLIPGVDYFGNENITIETAKRIVGL
jgi:capsular polysaccharide export protein